MPINTFVKGTAILSAAVNDNFSLIQLQDAPEDDLTAQIDGVNTVFTTTYPFNSGSIIVFVDGIRQRKGASYQFIVSSSSTITFNTDKQPLIGQDLVVSYRRSDL